MDVAVVGAGIVGASIAYHLARRGAAVTVLDQGPAPGSGATGDSFAWVGNTGGHWPGGADDLRAHVQDDYARLAADVPGVSPRRCGALTWPAPEAGTSPGPDPGPGRHLLDRDGIAALEPGMRQPPDAAVHVPTDFGIDPVAVTTALLRAAQSHGAHVAHGVAVTSVSDVQEHCRADHVVLAAGVGTGPLCAALGVRLPLATAPAYLLRFSAPPGAVRTIVAGPEFEVREVRDGHLLATAPYTEGGPLPPPDQVCERIAQQLATTFEGAAGWRLESWHVGRRPMPAHGPLIGYVGSSTYVAVLHSAVCLGPTVGRLVAAELLDDTPHKALRRCRPHAA
ncbi:NAD(P)/FAD-dependent oxidoreductase [Streptomyces sp. NPDC003860]